jgi:hypothetical protein
MQQKIRARTASDVQRLRSILAIKLLKNRELFLVGVRQKDGSTTVIESIPKTTNERYVELTVPGVTRLTLQWEDIMSIESLPSAGDDDEPTDRPHPFSASDLPFSG